MPGVRQFGIGWGWDNAVTNPAAPSILVPSPAIGRVRHVEVVRLKYTRAAEGAGVTPFWLLLFGPVSNVIVHARSYTQGSHELWGPWVVDSNHTLRLGPVFATPDTGRACAEWSER